ncbi:hypothetical protein MPSEU_000306000 [Mayamaea pseudoterrestris]|nr:hypothetical protein MPSEU_000306000 [Mayamaea pseudoterrestris]
MVAASSTPLSNRRSTFRSRAAAHVAPILIELSLQSNVVKAGFAGQASAVFLLPLPPLTKPMAQCTAQDYYYTYSPVMQQLLYYLPQSPLLSERKAIIVFDSGLYLHQPLQDALVRILLHVVQCKAVSFVSNMLMVGMSLMLLPESSASADLEYSCCNANSTCLAVHLTNQEAQCIVCSSHQALPFTYQSTGSAGKEQQQLYWNTPIGTARIVASILHCLHACPRDLRKQAIHNLYICGGAANDVMAVKIAKQLQETLLRNDSDDQVTMSAVMTNNDDDTTATTNPAADEISYMQLLTVAPANVSVLQPLADYVSVVALPQLMRPDLAVWMGASLYANHVLNKNADSDSFTWITQC